MSSDEGNRPHCLPGCKRIDGHDGRDLGACLGADGEMLWAPDVIPPWCYRLPGGSMVHVKPGCRC